MISHKNITNYTCAVMFHISEIYVFDDCEQSLRKNLQTDKPYRFERMTQPDFFARGISVNAIVGKNGHVKINGRKDFETVVKAMCDYYKKGEVSGKSYGTFSGRELKEVGNQ